MAQGVSAQQLPGLLVLLGVVGLTIACWRRSPVTSFGLAWVVLTLLPASNFVVPAGSSSPSARCCCRAWAR